MAVVYTVIDKGVMLKILDGIPCDFINNLQISNSIVDKLKQVIYESTGKSSLFPCKLLDGDAVNIVDALQESFPINWKTHMVLRLSCDESRFVYYDYNELLDISTNVANIDALGNNSDFSEYKESLLSNLSSKIRLGISENPNDVNVLTGFILEDITHYLILDRNFDINNNAEDTEFSEMDRRKLQQAVTMSVF